VVLRFSAAGVRGRASSRRPLPRRSSEDVFRMPQLSVFNHGAFAVASIDRAQEFRLCESVENGAPKGTILEVFSAILWQQWVPRKFLPS